MSHFDLQEAKDFLDVIHSADDAKLQGLLDGAEQEALDYMDRPDFASFDDSDTSSEEGVPSVVKTAVFFLLQSVYQATPEQRKALREAAEVMCAPHRLRLGI